MPISAYLEESIGCLESQERSRRRHVGDVCGPQARLWILVGDLDEYVLAQALKGLVSLFCGLGAGFMRSLTKAKSSPTLRLTPGAHG